jgi:predicted nucleic acid-binding Zn ribbon protein
VGQPEKIDSILDRLVARMGITGRLEREKAVVSWEEAVGSAIACRAAAVSISGGRLVVAVENSAWLQELAMMKESIIDKVNSRVGKPVVEDIIFRIGNPRKDEAKEKSNGG